MDALCFVSVGCAGRPMDALAVNFDVNIPVFTVRFLVECHGLGSFFYGGTHWGLMGVNESKTIKKTYIYHSFPTHVGLYSFQNPHS